MSLETTTLIGILTLLAICLGVSFLWTVVIETAIQSIGEPVFLEVTAKVRSQVIQLMSVVFSIALTCAIILNTIVHSRSEPYLLRIGLIGLILSFGSVFSKFVFLEGSAIALKFPWINNLLLWFGLLCLIVSYWSFLHYALNPKI